MKIAVIGAGSTYTPELVTGFAHVREHLQVDELALMDINPERLRVVGDFASRILANVQLPIRTSFTADVEEAVTGADAVLIQIRVGGQRMRLLDETLPLQHGCIGQETTGAGGAMKALRTVPVVLGIADAARRLAKPDAWIVDFTNPVGIVSRALQDAGHRSVGLCNYAIGIQRWAAQLLGVEPDRVLANPVGLNHFSWTRSILLDGEEVLPEILDKHSDAVSERFGFPEDLIRRLHAIPSYYLSWYYFHDRKLAKLKTETPRAAEVQAVEDELLKMYADPRLVERPALLEKRGGAYYSEAAAELLASLLGDAPRSHVINVRNNGLFAGLADDDIVETLCAVDRAGVRPVAQDPMPPIMLGPVQHVLAYERQIAAAAVSGDETAVKDALLTHPLIGQYDVVEDMLPELLHASARYLPAFARD
jgi:6-phospho-beta-glucosidase